MSKIEELIQQYCPDGVEYKTIKETYTRIKGTPITAGKMKEIANEDGDVRIYAGGKTVVNAFEKDIPNANITKVPAVLVQSRGVIDAIYYDKPFTFKNEMWAYTTDNPISVKYLYYVLKNNIQHFRDEASGMGSLPQISLHTTEDFSIPVPPLPVQEEIVRILDNFTTLEAELEAELDCRKRQYEYYRDKMLNVDCRMNNVEWKKLGEIFEMRNGYTPSKANADFWENGTIPWFRMEDIRENGRILSDSIQHITIKGVKGKGLFSANSFILATTATIGEHALLIADSLANQRFTNLKIRESLSSSINVKYMFYYMFIVDDFCKKHTNKSGFESVDMGALKNMLIPIPPLAVQERIVNVLDNFEQLCNDLGIGLPAEIEARKKQYEYYRNKLLSFKGGGQLIDNQYITFGIKVNDYIKMMQYVFGYVYVPMSEIAEICPGKDYRHLSNGEVPVYGSGGVMTYVNDYVYDKPTVLLPRKGSISNIFYVDEPFWNVDTIYYTKVDNTKVITKFLYYLIVNEHIEKYNTSNAARPALTRDVLNKIVLFLPSLSEQERIVAILDKFDALVNDISIGLPAEIEARRKQCEYYRNKLLTFRECRM